MEFSQTTEKGFECNEQLINAAYCIQSPIGLALESILITIYPAVSPNNTAVPNILGS